MTVAKYLLNFSLPFYSTIPRILLYDGAKVVSTILRAERGAILYNTSSTSFVVLQCKILGKGCISRFTQYDADENMPMDSLRVFMTKTGGSN
jgi:hypothetical protein